MKSVSYVNRSSRFDYFTKTQIYAASNSFSEVLILIMKKRGSGSIVEAEDSACDYAATCNHSFEIKPLINTDH